GLLRREGQVRRVAAGEVLFREGDRGYDFIVSLSGRVAIVDHQAKTERELATGGHGQFVPELSLLTGERLFTTAVVTEPGEVLAVGGGNSAGQAAIWLAGRGHPVTMALRGADLAESMSRYLIGRIAGRPDIEVRYHAEVRELVGSRWLERVEVENFATGTRETVRAAALVI